MADKTVLLGIFGAGGFAREIMPYAKAQFWKSHPSLSASDIKVVFIETEPSSAFVNGYEVVSEEEFKVSKSAEKYYNIAIGSSDARQSISERLSSVGCKPASLFAPSSIVYDANILGEGATICDNVMITSNATIGRFFQANIYSYVAHDCEIGDFVTFAPRVSCNGNVKVCDHAYIGTGAVIKQGSKGNPVVIGKGAIVGMGAVVTRSVPDYATVVGNPAKELVRK